MLGCCFVIFSVSWMFYGVAYALLFGSKETTLVPLATNLLYGITYMIAGASMYILSRPLAYLIARKLKSD